MVHINRALRLAEAQQVPHKVYTDKTKAVFHQGKVQRSRAHLLPLVR